MRKLNGQNLFTGREIVPALVRALEAWPNEAEPTTITAGENMEIAATFAVEAGGVIVGFDECIWNGSEWLMVEARSWNGQH